MTKHQGVLGNAVEVEKPVSELAKIEGAVALVRLTPSGSQTRPVGANLNRQSALELAADLIEMADEHGLAVPVRKAAYELTLVPLKTGDLVRWVAPNNEAFAKYANAVVAVASGNNLTSQMIVIAVPGGPGKGLLVKRNELGNPLTISDDGEKATVE